ncbi:DegV family protein [candidate division WOR-3 bacterium]|nr:DegV family protein [candidate division WOR-3 bacterium]
MDTRKIGIVTDETSNIPPECAKALDIEVAKFQVWFPDDDEEVYDTKKIYRQMREKEKMAKTSAPSPLRFKKAYEKQLKKYDQVLAVLLYKGFSGSFDSAHNAREQMDPDDKNKITLFDSNLASVAEGLVVWRAHDLIANGMELNDVVASLEEFRHTVKLLAFIEDLKWLVKGGRLHDPWAKPALAMQNAGFRPAIGIVKGQVKMTGLKMTGKDYIKAMIREIARLSKKGPLTAAFAHADLAEDALSRFRHGIQALDVNLLFTAQLTPLIGSHTGPGTVMVAYHY